MCSYHSIERANERTRYNGKSAVRFIENGIARGKTADDYLKEESEYLLRIPHDKSCTARVYNGYCLIVSDDGECLTLFPLPEWFGKKRFYDGKNRIRNIRRYSMQYMDSM